MWKNDFDKYRQELEQLQNPKVEVLQENVNQILKPENKGVGMFYPYRSGQTHAGIKRDYSIVIELLETYLNHVTPYSLESETSLNEPKADMLRHYAKKERCFRKYLDHLNFIKERIELLKKLQKLAETGMSHREKQRMIHLTLHSHGVNIGSQPLETTELPEGEQIVQEYSYQTDILHADALRYLEDMADYFQQKSEDKETLKEMPNP